MGQLRGSVHGKILCFTGPPGTVVSNWFLRGENTFVVNQQTFAAFLFCTVAINQVRKTFKKLFLKC